MIPNKDEMQTWLSEITALPTGVLLFLVLKAAAARLPAISVSGNSRTFSLTRYISRFVCSFASERLLCVPYVVYSDFEFAPVQVMPTLSIIWLRVFMWTVERQKRLQQELVAFVL